MRGTACAADKEVHRAQARAPDTPPIMVCGISFLLVRGVHGNPLRSRERRSEPAGRSTQPLAESGLTRKDGQPQS